jgi:cytochrome P450
MINYRTRGDSRALTDDEISDQLTCPFIGNVETAAKPIAIGLRDLSLHPDQLAAVRADLDKNVPIAVEEILRLGTTAQWAVRTVHKDFTIAGQHIKPGQRVMFLMFSAARDEREYENPEAFIWNRSIRRSLVFGLGQHNCVGSHIARLQIRVLIHEFLAHVKSYDFDMSEAEHSITYFHWGWMKLPVVIHDYAI